MRSHLFILDLIAIAISFLFRKFLGCFGLRGIHIEYALTVLSISSKVSATSEILLFIAYILLVMLTFAFPYVFSRFSISIFASICVFFTVFAFTFRFWTAAFISVACLIVCFPVFKGFICFLCKFVFLYFFH